MKTITTLVLLVANCVIASVLEKPTIDVIEDLEIPNIRIIDGQPAVPGQFPYQTFNKRKKRNIVHVCGGALICDKWVLTAGHCIRDGGQFTIQLGSVNRKDPSEPGRVIIEGKRAVKHKIRDIGLIELKQRVSYSNYIKPIPLDNEYLGGNHSVIVSGFGSTHKGPNHLLNYVELTTMSNKECKRYLGSLINETICATGQNKKNICFGDSGGALVRTNSKNQLVHVGVLSWMVGKCKPGMPSGYARTASYADWIKSEINGTCTLPTVY